MRLVQSHLLNFRKKCLVLGRRCSVCFDMTLPKRPDCKDQRAPFAENSNAPNCSSLRVHSKCEGSIVDSDVAPRFLSPADASSLPAAPQASTDLGSLAASIKAACDSQGCPTAPPSPSGFQVRFVAPSATGTASRRTLLRAEVAGTGKQSGEVFRAGGSAVCPKCLQVRWGLWGLKLGRGLVGGPAIAVVANSKSTGRFPPAAGFCSYVAA